jgi:DHA1 family tetracycline resistance protein-like MFS transporter
MLNKPVIIILMTILLDAMGVGIMIPVLPDLMASVLPDASLADATLWGGILATIFALMQFLFSPTLGVASDQYGRKPVLMIALTVMIAYYLIMAVAQHLWLLVIGRIMGGLTAATHATASAYIADISEPDEKAARFGLLGAAFGVGFVLGPIIGGVLGELGPRAPFYAAAVTAALNAVFCWIWLKESVTDDIRRKFSWKRANPFGAALEVSKFAGVGHLLWVLGLFLIGVAVYAAIWPFFTVERFDWSPGMIGVSLTLYGICFAIIQGALVNPAIKRFGERRTVVLGFSAEIIALMVVAFIPNGFLMLAFTPMAAIGVIGQPPLQAILSKAVGDDNQGTLQGVIGSLNAVAMIITPLVMSALFYAFTDDDAPFYFPGAPFFVSAILVAVALWVFLSTRAKEA